MSGKWADLPNHPRSTFYDYQALSQQADWIFVMCWGIHWATSAPGSLDETTWMKAVMDYTATMPNSGRFVIGTALYGFDWPNGGGTSNPATPYEYSDIQALLARTGVTPRLDTASDSMTFSYSSGGVNHDVWYADASTTHDRLQMARDHGFGLGLWRLGGEDQRIWDDPLLAAR